MAKQKKSKAGPIVATVVVLGTIGAVASNNDKPQEEQISVTETTSAYSYSYEYTYTTRAETVAFNDIWETEAETVPKTEYIPETTTEQTQATWEETTTEYNGVTVYYTNTGKKYHYDNHCNDGKYFPCTLDQALDMGLDPCKKCAGG